MLRENEVEARVGIEAVSALKTKEIFWNQSLELHEIATISSLDHTS
jgi:hypothetical protein